MKLMMIVTTIGYIVSAIGPYLADDKHADAKILNHIISTDKNLAVRGCHFGSGTRLQRLSRCFI